MTRAVRSRRGILMKTASETSLRPRGSIEDTSKPVWRSVLTSCAVCGGFIAVILVVYGAPLDSWSIVGLCLGIIVALVGVRSSYRRIWLAIAVLFYASFFFPLESDNLVDIRSGRFGVALLPTGFRFGRHGPNSALLQSYLGPLTPEWSHSSIRSMLLHTWRDGDERVNSRSIIFRDSLPQILNRLPSDDARRQVLRCVTDSDNLLRVHQGLLLTCLNEWGYPPGFDANSWWVRHALLFHAEYDVTSAIELVWGWTDRIREVQEDRPREINAQLYAADNQEKGSWGGDVDFRRFFELRLAQDDPSKPLRPDNRVAWWPRRK